MFARSSGLLSCSGQRCPAMRRRSVMACCVALWLGGCGDTPKHDVETSRPDLWQNPLTISAWEQSQEIEKYGPEVLQRLRTDNPELRSRENWKKFNQEVVLPGFRREVLQQHTASKD